MTNNQAIEALLRIRCIIREDSLEEQALVYAIEALECKDTDVPSNDTISRQQAIDAIDEIESEVADGYGYQYGKWRKYFCELPPAPERKPGIWIDEGFYADGHGAHAFRCSECGGHIIEYDTDPFCKWCGADMR